MPPEKSNVQFMPRSGYLSVEKNQNNIFAPPGATYFYAQDEGQEKAFNTHT